MGTKVPVVVRGRIMGNSHLHPNSADESTTELIVHRTEKAEDDPTEKVFIDLKDAA